MRCKVNKLSFQIVASGLCFCCKIGHVNGLSKKREFAQNSVMFKISSSLHFSLQASLATFGIETQTPQQIEPIQIWPPSELVKVKRHVQLLLALGYIG